MGSHSSHKKRRNSFESKDNLDFLQLNIVSTNLPKRSMISLLNSNESRYENNKILLRNSYKFGTVQMKKRDQLMDKGRFLNKFEKTHESKN